MIEDIEGVRATMRGLLIEAINEPFRKYLEEHYGASSFRGRMDYLEGLDKGGSDGGRV